MKKNIAAAATLILLGVAQTAAAQLYTCTGQNDACTICDFFAMVVKVIGITLKFIVPSAIILAVIAAGVMMMLKQEDPDVWPGPKKIKLTAIIGGLVAYGGWLLVSVSLAGMNSLIKTLGGNLNWSALIAAMALCKRARNASPGFRKFPATKFCKIITEKKTVVQDLCGTANGGKDLTDPGVSFDIVRAQEFLEMKKGSGEIRHVNAIGGGFFVDNGYSCDEVCAARGQKCIGVGLTNVAVNRCVSVMNHIANTCDLSENLGQGSGCSEMHGLLPGATCLETSSPCKPEWEPCEVYAYDWYATKMGAVEGQSYVQFSVGETACYCQ